GDGVVFQLIKGRLSGVMPKATGAAMAALVLAAGGSVSAIAQEGHPIKGSWIGTWESNDVHGEFVLLVMNWDGEKITGIINPGTDNIEITRATLNPDGWVVQIEASDENAKGGPVHYQIEGRIENLELPNRSIVGTWKHERGSGAFEVSRQ
ncbi:MAG: hypothetical protein LOD94_16510, partial [Gammaproteobacteria bacterium]